MYTGALVELLVVRWTCKQGWVNATPLTILVLIEELVFLALEVEPGVTPTANMAKPEVIIEPIQHKRELTLAAEWLEVAAERTALDIAVAIDEHGDVLMTNLFTHLIERYTLVSTRLPGRCALGIHRN